MQQERKRTRFKVGDQVIIRRLGMFGQVSRVYRVEGRAIIEIRMDTSDLVISISPLELVLRDDHAVFGGAG